MSIPPLVCSTPPPPDQCEDEKDPEDFDLPYNLSQDEDYDYGSFSTYTQFQSAISESKPLESPINNTANNNVNNCDNSEEDNDKNDIKILQWGDITSEIKSDLNKQEPEIDINLNSHGEFHMQMKTNFESNLNIEDSLDIEDKLHIDKKLNNEEELNIEDLNLTVEEEESLGSNVKNELDDAQGDEFDSSDKDKAFHIPNFVTSTINETNIIETVLPLDENSIAAIRIDYIDKPPLSKESQNLGDEEETYTNVKNEHEQEYYLDTSNASVSTQDPATSGSVKVTNELNNETDDEFADFNDFHVTSDVKPSAVVNVCDNPWENNQTDSHFKEFEANFDETENMEPPLFQCFEEKSVPVTQNYNNDFEDNDFGDFDDFKSSVQKTTNKEVIQDPLSQVPVLDFQTLDSESQVLENINKILNPIFVADIPEPASAFEGKLESLLCETWGHLLETDVRQPYIVNWNSSFGQKTLLKALCIDSRNILFGPKWNYNMPKYAANLSAAPLQPQKKCTPSGSYQSEVNSDKNTIKSTTWSDPFTSDGQESSKKENNGVAQKIPSDLNVLESEVSTKPDKIYSNTLGVQPLRQINLPDTHIFTPTDSETPRSKTIHYNGPSVFLSQSSTDNNKKSTDTSPSESACNVQSESIDDGDYSDFQDFKGSVHVLESKPASEPSLDNIGLPENTMQLPSTSTTYPIGILQPIKLEPTMPTLNWPSPGEVKETFDDFSEFASNSTWTNETEEIQPPSIDTEKNHYAKNDDSSNMKNNEVPPRNINDNIDDEFDTFQSALPTNKLPPIVPSINNFSNIQATSFGQNISSHISSNQEANFDFAFPKIDIVKSDVISQTRPNDILKYRDSNKHQPSIDNTPKVKEPIVKIPVLPVLNAQTMTSNVLLPTVSSSQTQQNTEQILQPLSLESFSQINWPNPGINFQDLSRFNPVETLNSLKSDLSVSGNSKGTSPIHNQKSLPQNQSPEDDIWGEFVSSKPKPQQSLPKKAATFADDDEWTDFVSSPTVKPQNGLNTISLNVHTNLNMQKSTKQSKLTVQNNQALEIPSLNYITPKSSNHNSYKDRHFQNL